MRPFVHRAEAFAYFQWNLDQSVGKAGQNGNAADTSFIQWYYTLAATNVLTPADRKQIYGRVRITGACSGRDGDALVDAITAHQQGIQHPIVDGRVSVAHGDGKIAGKAFFILRLGARFANMYPRAWPRLDLIQGCPPIVAKAVLDAIPHP